MDRVVDIADFQVADDPRATLVTYSLGGCIGVAIWDPRVRVGGFRQLSGTGKTYDQDTDLDHQLTTRDLSLLEK
ncbi:MAG: hypothetical protein IIB57_10855 [Planctomycetes bacterium]|nr:hypothetical protein [Planctomycetota bacterium]